MLTLSQIENVLVQIVNETFHDRNFGAASVSFLLEFYKNKLPMNVLYNLRLNEYTSTEAQFHIFFRLLYTEEAKEHFKLGPSYYIPLQNAIKMLMYNSTIKGLEEIFRFLNSKQFDPRDYTPDTLHTKLYEFVHT